MTDKDGLDPKLQQLYRQLPKEQPSAELDAKIINAAQLAVHSKKSWQQPFALAATLTITASLIWYWQAEQPLQLERAVSVAKESVPNAPMPTQTPIVEAITPELRQDSAVIAQANVTQQAHKKYTELDHTTTADDKMVAAAKSDEGNKANGISEHKEAEATSSLAKNAPAPVIAESLPEPASEQRTAAKLSAANQQAVMADAIEVQERAAGAIAPQASLAKSKKAKAERQTFSATIEGISIGMSQAQLLDLGFDCQNDVCQKTLIHPNQLNYWGMPATKAQLTVFIREHKVNQIVLAQQQASFEQVTQQIAQLGEPTERDCGLQEGTTVKAKSLRIVDGYLLQVRQLDQQVTVTICSAQ